MKTLISIITLSLGLLCFAESRTVGELHDGDTVITAESDPTVPAWAKENEPPPTMTTNAVRDIVHPMLDEKLDKTGGTITGNLAVDGDIDASYSEVTVRELNANRDVSSHGGLHVLSLKADSSTVQSRITELGILKGAGSGDVMAATPSSTGGANADYRDPQDNTCHKTELSDTDFTPSSEIPSLWMTWSLDFDGYENWTLTINGYARASYGGDLSTKVLSFIAGDPSYGPYPESFTRKSFCTFGKTFVTEDYVQSNYVVKSSDNVSIGSRAAAQNTSVAVGADSLSLGQFGSAIGYGSVARGGRSLALGTRASATSSASTAIGYMATSHGEDTFNVSQDIGRWYAGEDPFMSAMMKRYVQTNIIEVVTNDTPLLSASPSRSIVTNVYTIYVPDGTGARVAYDDKSSLARMMTDAATNATDDCECIKTNMCNLIRDEVEDIAKDKIDSNVAPWARTDSPQPLTSKPQYTPDEVGAYPASSGESLEQNVQVLSTHLGAEDARVTVTNYDSVANMPSAMLEYRTYDPVGETNFWKVVWNELTRWNWLTGTYLPLNFYNKTQIDSMVNSIAWGVWDSHTGGVAPDKTISMSADRVILCKGASYQRTVTAHGSYFVWTANMPYEVTGIESNGFFRIEDAEGNVTFEIVKGDKVTAAANPDGLYTEQVVGITHLHIHYPIEADTHPELEICDNLTTHDWKVESDSSCIANVSWSGTSGNYYAEVWAKTSKAQIFVKGTYQKGSDPYVRYASALDVQQLRIGGVIYNVGTATISGHTVLTLTPAN